MPGDIGTRFGLSAFVLLLSHDVLNVSFKVQSDDFAWLIELPAQVCFLKATACDFNFFLIKLQLFTKCVTGWDMHHIVYE